MTNSKEMAIAIAQALDSKRGDDILILEVKHLTSITDYFVIASGRNALSVRAMAETVEEKMEALGEVPRRKEGYADARWIVLDYASVIVHVFHQEERAYYNIERLWTDGGNRIAFTGAEEA